MIKRFKGFHPNGAILPYINDDEPDVVSTAFFLSFSALGCDFSVRGISIAPGSTMDPFLSLVRKMGLNPVKGFMGLKLQGKAYSSLEMSVSRDNLDLVPILMVLASNATGDSVFSIEDNYDDEYLSKSLKSFADFAKALDLDYILLSDRLLVRGRTKKILDTIVDTKADYRIALAAILASVLTDEEISISYVECLDEKYPSILEDLDYLIAK